MLDALLYAVRDAIRAAGMNYGKAECELCDDEGKPPPRCGNVFVSVHKGKTREWSGNNDNNLAELYDFSVTLTMRLGRVSLDNLGDQLIARNIARVPQANREGFNAKVEQLRAFLHMNWRITVLVNQTPASANDNLSAWAVGTVYGFVEPARYRGSGGGTQLVGGEWFDADPEAEDFGIKQELRFEGAKRFQPVMLPAGPFV